MRNNIDNKPVIKEITLNTPLRVPVGGSKENKNQLSASLAGKTQSRVAANTKKTNDENEVKEKSTTQVLSASGGSLSRTEIEEQMSKIREMLDNMENDWEQRASSMEKLQNLCKEVVQGGDHLSFFVDKLDEMRSQLAKQV